MYFYTFLEVLMKSISNTTEQYKNVKVRQGTYPPHTEKGAVAPKSVEQSLSLSNETLEAVRAANADDAQLYALAQSLAADDARCLSGHTARPKHAAAILQLVRNGTATNLVTISDDESGLPAFRVSRRGKWKTKP